MISPSPLKKGDKIALVAPARKIAFEEVAYAVEFIHTKGFEAVFHDSLFAQCHQFAGNDGLRTAALQQYLDDPTIRAILFVRGGYGSVRIIDELDSKAFVKTPKWLAGYSDMTVFLNHVNTHCHIETIHGPMPFGFKDNTREAVQSLFAALQGKAEPLKWSSHPLSRQGMATGELIGGNLSVLYSLLGSNSFPETEGKILFLEDLDEYLYHIDRMMMALKRAGKLSQLSGMVVGGLTDMRDNLVPFGKTAEEIVSEMVELYDYPVAFGCPAGHLADNQALIMGREVRLSVDKGGNVLEQ